MLAILNFCNHISADNLDFRNHTSANRFGSVCRRAHSSLWRSAGSDDDLMLLCSSTWLDFYHRLLFLLGNDAIVSFHCSHMVALNLVQYLKMMIRRNLKDFVNLWKIKMLNVHFFLFSIYCKPINISAVSLSLSMFYAVNIQFKILFFLLCVFYFE